MVALTLGSVAVVERGLELRLGAAKTDQAGKGATIAIPEGTRLRPKAQLIDWIAAVDAEEAGLDRTPAEKAALPLFRRLTRGERTRLRRCRTRRWRG